MACKVQAAPQTAGIHSYYQGKIEELEAVFREKAQNLSRLEAQRNELNGKVRLLREELQLLQEPGSYVGEVVKAMGKNKVLVKVNPEGKYVVDLDKNIDVADIKPNLRVALRNDSYVLHKVGIFFSTESRIVSCIVIVRYKGLLEGSHVGPGPAEMAIVKKSLRKRAALQRIL